MILFCEGSPNFWTAAPDAGELGDTPFADSHMCDHASWIYAEKAGLELFRGAGGMWILYPMGEACFSR